MKVFYVDTNALLRLLLKDNPEQCQQVKDMVEQAKRSEIVLKVMSQVVFELSFVLLSYYRMDRESATGIVLTLLQSPYFDIEDREVLLETFNLYLNSRLALVDSYLVVMAKRTNSAILTFDKDLLKTHSHLTPTLS